MKIDAIKNGFVVDHIPAGRSMELYSLLGLADLPYPVAIIKNAPSRLMGKKDIIKIDADIEISLDVRPHSPRPRHRKFHTRSGAFTSLVEFRDKSIPIGMAVNLAINLLPIAHKLPESFVMRVIPCR